MRRVLVRENNFCLNFLISFIVFYQLLLFVLNFFISLFFFSVVESDDLVSAYKSSCSVMHNGFISGTYFGV